MQNGSLRVGRHDYLVEFSNSSHDGKLLSVRIKENKIEWLFTSMITQVNTSTFIHSENKVCVVSEQVVSFLYHQFELRGKVKKKVL